MVDHKDTQSERSEGENKLPRAELRVVSDRVSESFCSVLTTGREKKGLSQKEVADSLHISLHIIRALEDRRFEVFPEDTYTIGYIRSYAGLLGLNPEGLVKDYRQSKELLELTKRDREAQERIQQQEALKKQAPAFDTKVHDFADAIITFKNKYSLYLLSLLLGLVLGAALFFSLASDGELESANIKPIERVKILGADGSIVVRDLMEKEQVTPVISPEALEAEIKDKLSMRFSGTTWVTVRDMSGELIHQSRKQSGENLNLNGQAPFYIQLSKASVVVLSFNDQQIDFSAQVTDDDQLHDFELSP